MTYRSSAKLDGTYRGSMKLSGAKSQVGVASTTHSRETRTCQATCAAIVGVANRLDEMYGKQIVGRKAIAFFVWQTDTLNHILLRCTSAARQADVAGLVKDVLVQCS